MTPGCDVVSGAAARACPLRSGRHGLAGRMQIGLGSPVSPPGGTRAQPRQRRRRAARSARRASWPSSCASAIAGCMVGPDFVRPKAGGAGDVCGGASTMLCGGRRHGGGRLSGIRSSTRWSIGRWRRTWISRWRSRGFARRVRRKIAASPLFPMLGGSAAGLTRQWQSENAGFAAAVRWGILGSRSTSSTRASTRAGDRRSAASRRAVEVQRTRRRGVGRAAQRRASSR